MTLEEFKSLKEQGAESDVLIRVLDEIIASNPSSDEAYTQRGLIYWSMGKRAEAIRDYLAAIRINPKSQATLALKTTNQILDYYNKDLYNP